jgi:hypothetical protein
MNHTIYYDVLYTIYTPDFSVAEHYGLRNTTCLYSKDVASVFSGFTNCLRMKAYNFCVEHPYCCILTTPIRY